MINLKKIVDLKNKKGEKTTFLLRPYQTGDEKEMLTCIREEYGETYFKREFYDSAYIRKKAKDGEITFLLAETSDGEIAGMMLLKQFYPQEEMCEIASQIFRKKYRGYGLATHFFSYGMKILKSGTYTAAYCLPVLFHDITQRLLYKQGMRGTGLILNVFDVEKIVHSYIKGRNTKHSQGIQISAMAKQNAGMLYLPSEHQDFCSKIYERLGVDYCFAEAKEGTLASQSSISFKQEERQQNLEICIYSVGADLKDRIRQIQEDYPLSNKQTAGVFLNCNDAHAVWAYQILKELGYFFTGLKPLCSDREYMVLHHPGEVEIFFEDYQLSDEFTEIVNYVQQCYEERKAMHEDKKEKYYPTEINDAVISNGIADTVSCGES